MDNGQRDDKWFVIDIDFESESGAEKELKRFLRGELKTGEIKLKVRSEGATVVEAPKKNPESLKPAALATPPT